MFLWASAIVQGLGFGSYVHISLDLNASSASSSWSPNDPGGVSERLQVSGLNLSNQVMIILYT